MAEKDFYKILGVDKGATQAEIKKAHRSLARKYHPDVNSAQDSEDRLKEINQAYEVLGNPQKKEQYDRFGTSGFNQGFNGFSGFGGSRGPYSHTYTSNGSDFEFDLGDLFGGNSESIFETFFGGMRRKGKDYRYQALLELRDAIKGITQELEVEGKKIKIKIPAGVLTGTEIRYTGKGGAGPVDPRTNKQFPNGDLYLIISVRPIDKFIIKGENIFVRKEIMFTQALLGDIVEVNVVEPESSSGVGTVKLKIPPSTPSGKEFKLKNQGMPKVKGRGRGDAYVKVDVTFPTKLTKEQKKLIEEFEETLK